MIFDGLLRGCAARLKHGFLARLLLDERAVSAVEFGLLLPLMLVMYIAGSEVSQSIAIYRKVAQVAYTTGDLVTQVSSISTSDMTNILAASTSVMMPYNASGAQIVVGALNYNGSTYTVAWSAANSGTTSWAVGSTPTGFTIPANLVSTGQQVIVAQVKYTYTTAFTSVMQNIWNSSSITLGDVVYLRPRLSTTISYPYPS